MTQEEKIKEAKRLYKTANSDQRYVLESLFPELRESEDERIRKMLIEFFGNGAFCDSYTNGISDKDIIAWLEKQGNTNETINKDRFAQGVLRGAAINLITWIDYNAAEGNMCLSNMECKDIEDALVSGDWDKIYAYIKKKLEKQGEKPVEEYNIAGIKTKQHTEGKLGEIIKDIESEKVEPKFKVGDFVVDNCDYVWKIKEILNQCYLLEGVEGGESLPTIEWVNTTFHLWTIKDAKAGDVLVASNGSLFILAKVKDNSAYYHFSLWKNGSKEISDGNHSWENAKDCHPATKEQREQLEKAMADAGYIFDFDEKELKKIEDEIEISFGAKDSELQEDIYYIPKGFHAEIDDDKVVIKKGEKPTAWSEEDETGWTNTMIMIKEVASNHYTKDSIKLVVNFLKSIKERYTWNPTDEEMKEALRTEYEKGRADAFAEMQNPAWSEVDERILDSIIEDVMPCGECPDYPTDEEREYFYEGNKKVDWLKSLKDRVQPKSQWKPSEDQIKFCKEVYADLLSAKGFDVGTINSELNRLEEQLKKLREE